MRKHCRTSLPVSEVLHCSFSSLETFWFSFSIPFCHWLEKKAADSWVLCPGPMDRHNKLCEKTRFDKLLLQELKPWCCDRKILQMNYCTVTFLWQWNNLIILSIMKAAELMPSRAAADKSPGQVPLQNCLPALAPSKADRTVQSPGEMTGRVWTPAGS